MVIQCNISEKPSLFLKLGEAIWARIDKASDDEISDEYALVLQNLI